MDHDKEMKHELLRLMRVYSDNDWSPQTIICRWCDCWLEYTDDSKSKPEENHKVSCFAARVLGRPTKSK